MHTRTRFLVRNIFQIAVPMLSPIVALGLLAIFLIQSVQNNELLAKNLKILEQTRDMVETTFSTVDLVAASFDANAKNQQALKAALKQPSPTTYARDGFATIANLRDILASAQNVNPCVWSIYLYTDNPYGNYLSSGRSSISNIRTSDALWFLDTERMKEDQIYLTRAREIQEYSFDSARIACISVIRQIMTTSYSRNKTGVVVLNVNRHMLEERLRESLSSPRSVLALYDSKACLIASTDTMPAGEVPSDIADGPAGQMLSRRIAGETYICLLVESVQYGVRLLSLVPEREYYQRSLEMAVVAGLILLASLMLGIFLSYLIAWRNHRSLSHVLSVLSAAERGHTPFELPQHSSNEYEYILSNMVNTFVQQSFLRTQLSEKRYRLRAMELMALQAQINPHFLYNTLNTIFWKAMALTGGTNDVSRMIEYLSDILCYVFSVPGHYVPVRQEIQHAESYVRIQSIRHSGLFEVRWAVDEALMGASVMKLLLQPLIENSIAHGLQKKPEPGGAIDVILRRRGDRVLVAVRDNGTGMSAERLAEMTARLEDSDHLSEAEETGHIGLMNIKRRLIILYGPAHSLRIVSRSAAGTTVVIFYPYEPFEAGGADSGFEDAENP